MFSSAKKQALEADVKLYQSLSDEQFAGIQAQFLEFSKAISAKPDLPKSLTEDHFTGEPESEKTNLQADIAAAVKFAGLGKGA